LKDQGKSPVHRGQLSQSGSQCHGRSRALGTLVLRDCPDNCPRNNDYLPGWPSLVGTSTGNVTNLLTGVNIVLGRASDSLEHDGHTRRTGSTAYLPVSPAQLSVLLQILQAHLAYPHHHRWGKACQPPDRHCLLLMHFQGQQQQPQCLLLLFAVDCQVQPPVPCLCPGTWHHLGHLGGCVLWLQHLSYSQ